MEKLTLLKCGKLFDGLRDEIKDNIEVLILGETIIDLGKDKYSRNIDSVIDLSGEIVTPGLIDAHVHLSTFEWRNRQQEMTYHSQAWKGMAVLYNAERALRRGFTSLRFVGCNCSDGYSSLDAKNLIEKGYFAGSDLTIAPYYTGSIGGWQILQEYTHKILGWCGKCQTNILAWAQGEISLFLLYVNKSRWAQIL